MWVLAVTMCGSAKQSRGRCPPARDKTAGRLSWSSCPGRRYSDGTAVPEGLTFPRSRAGRRIVTAGVCCVEKHIRCLTRLLSWSKARRTGRWWSIDRVPQGSVAGVAVCSQQPKTWHGGRYMLVVRLLLLSAHQTLPLFCTRTRRAIGVSILLFVVGPCARCVCPAKAGRGARVDERLAVGGQAKRACRRRRNGVWARAAQSQAGDASLLLQGDESSKASERQAGESWLLAEGRRCFCCCRRERVGAARLQIRARAACDTAAGAATHVRPRERRMGGAWVVRGGSASRGRGRRERLPMLPSTPISRAGRAVGEASQTAHLAPQPCLSFFHVHRR